MQSVDTLNLKSLENQFSSTLDPLIFWLVKNLLYILSHKENKNINSGWK